MTELDTHIKPAWPSPTPMRRSEAMDLDNLPRERLHPNAFGIVSARVRMDDGRVEASPVIASSTIRPGPVQRRHPLSSRSPFWGEVAALSHVDDVECAR